MDGEGEGGGSEGIDIQDGGVRGDQLKLKRREEQVESEQRKRHSNYVAIVTKHFTNMPINKLFKLSGANFT